MSTPLICPYCGQPAVKMSSTVVYGAGRDYGPIWACIPCQAWVGCNKMTGAPLGRLADAGLRKWKQKAHAAFDPLWDRLMKTLQGGKTKCRESAYHWLADKMLLPREECHIGMFDEVRCLKVIEACSEHGAYAEIEARHAAHVDARRWVQG